jgi:RimJ/RimL family protein N-acetyltransferase
LAGWAKVPLCLKNGFGKEGWMSVPSLSGTRLQLRELNHDDLNFVLEMLSDPEMMKHYPKCYSRAEAKAWIDKNLQRYAETGCGFWIAELPDGTPVGQIGLLIQNVDGLQEPEVAYLISRHYWRQGFAREMAAAVRDWAMDVMGYSHVISLIRPSNLPSQGVARSIGMKPWKVTRHKGLEHLVFRIRRTDREKNRSGEEAGSIDRRS